MQIKTECPTCKNIYEVDSQYEGFEVECEGCHTSFTVVRKQTQVSTIPKKHRSLPSSGKIQKLLAEGEKVGFFDDSQYEKLHTITYHTESSVYLLIATIIRHGCDRHDTYVWNPVSYDYVCYPGRGWFVVFLIYFLCCQT